MENVINSGPVAPVAAEVADSEVPRRRRPRRGARERGEEREAVPACQVLATGQQICTVHILGLGQFPKNWELIHSAFFTVFKKNNNS